ncbi:tripartite tricarboxylate transporter TctB family protein [Bradyrhizobium jicamae]|nr:tripartite tricarboxylate transporter TctB family protein [Bradyrhizobium jicamae]
MALQRRLLSGSKASWFCWRCLTKVASKFPGQASKLSKQAGDAAFGEGRMNATPGQAPVKSIMPKWVRNEQDFVGGIAMMAIAAFALWASSDLQGMRGFSFGAGTAPRMFATLLLILGAGITAVGIFTEGQHLAKYHWRGPFFVTLAILSFSQTIRSMGMIFAAMTSFLIAACGSAETKWVETIIVGACLTAFCALLFPYALGLPLQLLPTFMIR